MQRVRRRILRLARRVGRAMRAEIQAYADRGPLRERTVLYESFAGNGVLCNPEALFRELLRTEDLSDLRHVWVLDDPRAHRAIRREFAGDDRVRFVRYRSVRYFRALATSGYLVNNATFPPEFHKRPGQIYLNTWHGTPLKLMGYDMPDGAAESANTLRNFVSADYLLSQNPFMTERMYKEAYRLLGAFRGLVVEEGYPRVDRQFRDANELAADRARLEDAGLNHAGRKIVLYAPTWKGSSFASPDDDAWALLDSVRQLQRLLGPDDYVVLLKTHQAVHRFAKEHHEFRSVLVPNDIPTNAMLGLTSILVTDYSSIFFDFLASDRPIVFYTPDADEYSGTRGTYFPPEQLPGPVFTDLRSVAEAIGSPAGGGQERRRQSEWRERFTPRDDGHAARRVIDVVFREHHPDHRLVRLADDSRERILLHLGGMRSNGITSSALNLLRSIDYERFDVSVVFSRPTGRQQRANQRRIDPRVRQFHRSGGMNGTKLNHLRRKVDEVTGRSESHRTSASQRMMWDAEWLRCFGASDFDYVADFSGYATFWATLLLHSPDAVRSIWLHNDMAAEVDRVIRGRRRMRRTLLAIFAHYHEFDALVSVSRALGEVNRASLGDRYRLPADAFVTASNLVDEEGVIEGMTEELTALADYPPDPETGEPIVPQWAVDLSARDDLVWFVSVGRFSTEKNQTRLLRAFRLVHDRAPHTRLLVIGYGPLRSELDSIIERIGLRNCAFLAGPFHNPFPVMAAADCFVLSSDYEGQPMVLLEAAIVGMPIVSVDFDSIGDALPDGRIRVVQRDDDALAEGMLAFLRGDVPPSTLDAARYNRLATREFVAAITGTAADRQAVRD